MIEILAQITGKDHKGRAFCAGIVLHDDVVVAVSPIVRGALMGVTRERARDLIRINNWKVTVVHELRRADPAHS